MTRVLLFLAGWLVLAVVVAVAVGRVARLGVQQPRPTLRLVPPLDEERAS